MPSERNASLDDRMTTLIDGKAIAQQVRAVVRVEIAAWVAQGHEPPGLATVLVALRDPGRVVNAIGAER